MSERINQKPMLFSTPMVQALLAGRKTQTRRILKPQPHTVDDSGRWYRMPSGGSSLNCHDCPYGVLGDLLWVRETWYAAPYDRDILGYVADGDHPHEMPYRVVPSIHMPRKFSRLTLRVTGVRVERLQEISDADANAEGVEWESADPPFCYVPGIWPHSITAVGIEEMRSGHERASYGKLWDHINGAGSWAANPLVWALTFERVLPP